MQAHLLKIFRAFPLWRTDRGTGVSPAGFASFYPHKRKCRGCKGPARGTLHNLGGVGVSNAPQN
ncbi:hypothetical protein K370107A2_09210 [Merdimmobilis hominis]